MCLSLNALRRSTGCAGMFTNSTPSAGRRHVHSMRPSISRRCRPGWTPWRDWSPNWPVPNWPTSSGSLSEINTLEQRLEPAGPRGRPRAARHPRLWGPDGGQARRRGRRGGPVQERGRLLLPRRGGPDPGLVGQHRRADAVEPLGQPPTQLRDPPHRGHPDPHARHRGPRLLPTAERKHPHRARFAACASRPS